MEDEKLADKLLDRILMVLMPYDQIDVERIKAKLTVVLDDYQISPKQEALAVYTEGKTTTTSENSCSPRPLQGGRSARCASTKMKSAGRCEASARMLTP